MIADLFIKRPKFAIVIAILMMLAGGICLNQLPIAEYPEIAPTSINVQATYTGASAQVVMETLASPIEEELNGKTCSISPPSQITPAGIPCP